MPGQGDIVRKVLIIDDDPVVVRLGEALLQKNGFNFIRATSATEGLEIASRQKPDLVVPDVVMPEMNGFEDVKRRRIDKRCPGGYADNEEPGGGHPKRAGFRAG